MPKPYKHLSQEEREFIAAQLSEGSSVGDIAKAVGRNKSTISRGTLRRNEDAMFPAEHMLGLVNEKRRLISTSD
jgi:IS30 family transposase